MGHPNYEYTETDSKETMPNPAEHGIGWEYWGDRITPDEHVAVWRRDTDLFN